MRKHYQLDGTGWGSPFLLVPEATSVDEDTLQRILKAKKSDFYLSHASPLGVPFNNLRNSSGEEQRLSRIEKNRPGSPCYKKFLSFSTEFSSKPICTASREYQNLKLKDYAEGKTTQSEMDEEVYQSASKIRKSINPNVKVRYAYYASDNPLETGSTLASGGLGTTGVKPTYLITIKILEQIFNVK